MSIVSFSDKFGQTSLFQNYQLQWQYINKFEEYNANKTTCNENNRFVFKQKQDLQGTIFCSGRIFSRKCSKSSILVYLISWNCIQYIFISRGAAFLIRQGYLKQGSNNILKRFLYFFIKNFWKKVDINFKSLNKINIRF